jgi:hypothetical protein
MPIPTAYFSRDSQLHLHLAYHINPWCSYYSRSASWLLHRARGSVSPDAKPLHCHHLTNAPACIFSSLNSHLRQLIEGRPCQATFRRHRFSSSLVNARLEPASTVTMEQILGDGGFAHHNLQATVPFALTLAEATHLHHRRE